MSSKALAEFLETPAGAQLHRWEAAQMDALMKTLSGETALQIGACFAKSLRSAPHGFKVALDSQPQLTHYPITVKGDARALPFPEEFFDLVILNHALESSLNPACVLDEAMRVLAPSGRIVILGLNPWGPWWQRRKEKLYADGVLAPVSVPWVKQQMSGVCRIDRGRFGIYSHSLSDNPNTLARWRWMEKAGDRWWPALANAYMLSGVKLVEKMTLVGKIAKECEKLGTQWVQAPAASSSLQKESKI